MLDYVGAVVCASFRNQPVGYQFPWECLIGFFRDISFDHTDYTAAPTCTSDFFIPEVQLSSAVTDFLCADCYPLQNYGYTYCDLLKAQTKTQRDWKQKPGCFWRWNLQEYAKESDMGL